MEAQLDEGSVQPLEDVQPADIAETQTLPRINPKWTPLDDFCAKLFGPWDDLPRYAQINDARLLRELDDAIVAFERHIKHSDAGFRVWRERHKKAMDAGLAEIHRYPCLQTTGKAGKHIWHDEVWEQRYSYLIQQRQQIIMDRLSRIKSLPRYAREDFFGTMPAHYRALLHKRNSGRGIRPFKLRCDWWWPVEDLLERAASRWAMDETALKATFWEALPTTSVKTKASRAWGDAIKEEDDPAERSTRTEKMESLEDKKAVGLVAKLVSGASCSVLG